MGGLRRGWQLYLDHRPPTAIGPAARFSGLGPDWHDRIAPLRGKRQLITELKRLSGQKVILHQSAA
jgi:hypothetical protein